MLQQLEATVLKAAAQAQTNIVQTVASGRANTVISQIETAAQSLSSVAGGIVGVTPPSIRLPFDVTRLTTAELTVSKSTLDIVKT